MELATMRFYFWSIQLTYGFRSFPVLGSTLLDPVRESQLLLIARKAQTEVPATNKHQRQHLSDSAKRIEGEADLRCKTRGLGTRCTTVPHLRPSGVASYDILMILYVNIQRYFGLQNSVPESV